MSFLASADGGRAWAERGNHLSTRDNVGADYCTGVDRQFATLLTGQRDQRFDASDLMPPDLRDTLMAEVTAFMGETSHLDQTADLDGLVGRSTSIGMNSTGSRATTCSPREVLLVELIPATL